MFDHLEWWQVLLVLAPLTGIMHLIRWRELMASSTSFGDMNEQQKAYLLLSLMPPGVSAQLWLEAGRDDLDACLREASRLRGTGRNLHEPVMKEFLKRLPKRLKDGEAADLHERYCNAFRIDGKETRKLFMASYGSVLGARG